MGKIYVKPVLELERFTLTTSIANTCGDGESEETKEATTTNVTDNGWQFFGNGIDCDIDASGVCYHVPTSDTTVFGS